MSDTKERRNKTRRLGGFITLREHQDLKDRYEQRIAELTETNTKQVKALVKDKASLERDRNCFEEEVSKLERSVFWLEEDKKQHGFQLAELRGTKEVAWSQQILEAFGRLHEELHDSPRDFNGAKLGEILMFLEDVEDHVSSYREEYAELNSAITQLEDQLEEKTALLEDAFPHSCFGCRNPLPTSDLLEHDGHYYCCSHCRDWGIKQGHIVKTP